MPELIEVEYYRRLAERTVGRTIGSVPVIDPLGIRDGTDAATIGTALHGATITGADRLGKLLLLHTDGPTLGIRFGMTGRLIVDGAAAIDALEYSSRRDDPAWDRLVVRFADGGDLRNRDPRRLGGCGLDPDLSVLGPEASTVSAAELRTAFGASRAPIKAGLLDQKRLAGLGNLLVDESLWRAGIAPKRPARTVVDQAAVALARTIRSTVADLTARGGSHRGDLHDHRTPGANCPQDGMPLRRERVGGRTTYWCPRHQT